MIKTVLSTYGLKEEETIVETFGKGLINNTRKVISGDKIFILQRINDTVFKQPGDIAYNIKLIKEYLHEHHPGYNFTAPVVSTNGDEMVFINGEGFFRLFPFVMDS